MFTLLLAMNRIRTILLVGLLIVSGTSYAQKGDFTPDKNSNWQDRIYFGGGFGLGGGTWGGSIRLSPMVGYMLTSKLSAGVGINYEYYWNNSYTPRLEDNRYGGLIFTRLNLFRNIFAYADYQFINLKYNYFTEERRTIDRLPVGLGLSQPIGQRSSINFIAAYDLLWDETAYASPWVFSVFFSL